MINIFVNKINKDALIISANNINTISVYNHRLNKPFYDLDFLIDTIEKSKKDVAVFVQDDSNLYKLQQIGRLHTITLDDILYFYIANIHDGCFAY